MKLIKRFTKYGANIFEHVKHKNKTEILNNSEVSKKQYRFFFAIFPDFTRKYIDLKDFKFGWILLGST